MTRTRRLALPVLFVAACLASIPSIARAQVRARIDPSIARALEGGRPPAPFFAARGAPTEHGEVAVLIELRTADPRAREAALLELARMGNQGVALRSPEGRPIVWQRWVPARVDARGLAALSRSTSIAAVHLSPRSGMMPLDRSADRIGLEAARGAGDPRFTGEGVTIADLDSAIDVFHPTFFRADAGWYDWVDVDRDGRFEAGTDAIDLDGDGVVSEREIVSVLRAAPVDFTLQPTDELRSGPFDPSIDWVFLDLDENGERSVGAAAGYDDATPALGEPLFVPDDLDGDGVLDPEERLVRLGTSKIRAYYVSVRGGSGSAHVYRRGVDLADAERDYTGGAHGYADTLHGSGVAGILMGDVPLVGRRWVGIAPDADLVHAFQLQDDPAAQLAWALGESPDVALHEYVVWTRTPLDGSDPVAAMIDESTASGSVAHVCPAGNIGGMRKHAVVTVAPGETATMPFRVDDPLRYVEITIHDDITNAGTIVLVEPNGTEHAWSPDGGVLSDGRPFYMSIEGTTRGYRMRGYTLYVESGTLPTGAWSVRVMPGAATTTTVHGFLADERGFALGAAWDESIATDRNTIAWPATSDACLGVGSVPSHTSDEGVWYSYAGDEPAGHVRSYSARGPRIDGRPSLGIVAPDNPWSALGAGDVFPTSPGSLVAPEGAFQVFGGTSGAGPHVAGVAALLAQHGVRGAAALETIRESAVHDAIAGTLPNDDYGAGRLSAAGALSVSPDGSPPRVTLRAEPPDSLVPTEIRLVVEASDPDGGELELRWDDDYDGTWDGDFAAIAERRVTVDDEGAFRWKVRVRDASGRIAEAAVVVRVGALPGVDGGVDLDGGLGDRSMAPVAGSGCGCRAVGAAGGSRSHLLVALAGLALLVVGRRRRS